MMRMILRCTGGFTGPAGAQTRTVDLAQLPQDQASQLEELVLARKAKDPKKDQGLSAVQFRKKTRALNMTNWCRRVEVPASKDSGAHHTR